MKTCTDLNNRPGPGDSKIWGLCTGHPRSSDAGINPPADRSHSDR